MEYPIKTTQQFPVIVESDETGGYVVECPLFQGCYSQGDTLDEALSNIREVIGMCLDEQKELAGTFVPKQVGVHMIALQ